MNGLSPNKYVPSTSIQTDPFSSRYTVQEDIGRGKFAVVKKCVCNETGEVVAAKIIRKRRKGKSCREEILREVVMLELAMAHPRLVSLREVFETNTELILVTEYCSGGELFHECIINESFQEDDVRKLLVQILEGLAYLHDNNIVHLDLKPQNILLTKPFPNGDVKICDLGFACLTNTGEDIRDIIGTPDYVAPEVLDYEPLNIQTDMWSLGVLTYVMLTTCSPFAGDDQNETFSNITQVKLDFPDELFGHINVLAQDFISKLLVKKPRDRLTAKECLDHPWLADLTEKMAISIPTSDHSFELAQEMITPSNWRLSVDRQTSITGLDNRKVNAETSTSCSDNSTIVTGISITEDKDLISKTLSHIDIDHGRLSEANISSETNMNKGLMFSNSSISSTSQYHSCVNTLSSNTDLLQNKTSEIVFPSLPNSSLEIGNAVSSNLTCSSSPNSASEENHYVTSLAADVIQDVLSASSTTIGNGVVQPPPDSSNDSSLTDSSADQSIHLASLPTETSHVMSSKYGIDTVKQQNAIKRMSMEIPPKKAKCVVDNSPPKSRSQVSETNGQAINHNTNTNHCGTNGSNMEDFRNAV